MKRSLPTFIPTLFPLESKCKSIPPAVRGPHVVISGNERQLEEEEEEEGDCQTERERERERVSAGERWGRWWWCRREMVVVAEEKVEDLVEEPVEEELVAMKEVKEVEEVEEVEEEGSARPAVRPGKNVRAHSNRSSAGARTRSAVFPRHGRSSFLLVPTARLPSHLLAGAFGLVSRRVDQSYKARLRAWDLDVGARASRCCCCRRCFCRRGCHRVRGRRAMRAPLD
jgi:hypothetical protein